jgi:hypothetical protein
MLNVWLVFKEERITMSERTDLLNLWRENTGGKPPVLSVRGTEPRIFEMTGYQPPKVDRIVTYRRG